MNVDPIAQAYRWLEYAAFGRALERSRFSFLPRLAGAENILVLGEGDGRTLARMLSIAPRAQIDVVELSRKMVELARKRACGSDRVRFRCEDALTVDWPKCRYDAVVTFYFLDCFGESEACHLISRLSRSLIPGGLWLVSDFAVPRRGWRRWQARLWITVMYRFFGLTTGLRVRELPPIERLLRGSGIHKCEGRTERGGMVLSELWRKPE